MVGVAVGVVVGVGGGLKEVHEMTGNSNVEGSRAGTLCIDPGTSLEKPYPGFNQELAYVETAYLEADYPVSSSILRKTVEGAFLGKLPLAEKMGLSGDLRWRVSLAGCLETFSSCPRWRRFSEFLRDPCGMGFEDLGLTPESVVNNCIVIDRSRRKLRKYLEQQGAETKFREWSRKKHPWSCNTEWVTFADLLFLEAASAREGKTAVISLNPIDQLLCSYNAEFSSCFRPGGENDSAPIALARMPETGVAFLVEPRAEDLCRANKKGRTHLYFPPGVVASGRLYNIQRGEAEEIVKLCASRLPGDFTYEGPTAVRVSSMVYLDGDISACLVERGKESSHYRVLESVCLFCGKDTARCSGLSCSDCDPCGCQKCGGEGEERPGGDTFCDDCWEALHEFCSHCDDLVLPADAVYINDDRYLCEDCVPLYQMCEECRAWSLKHMGRFCEDCAHHCEHCGFVCGNLYTLEEHMDAEHPQEEEEEAEES